MNLYKPEVCNLRFESIECKRLKTNVQAAVVDINPTEYKECEDFAKLMWANNRQGPWGRGMVNNEKDPYLAERSGLLGEMAVAKILDLSVNTTYKVGGDATDFIINGFPTDVKTAITDHGALLIKATKGANPTNRLELRNDIYIAAYVLNDDRENKFAKIAVMGFFEKSLINESYFKKARRPGMEFWNWDIPYTDLNNIGSLVAKV
jgi:hypothetical protein